MSKLSLCNVYHIMHITEPDGHPFIVVTFRDLWGSEDDEFGLVVHDVRVQARLKEWCGERRMVCVDVTSEGDIHISKVDVFVLG